MWSNRPKKGIECKPKRDRCIHYMRMGQKYHFEHVLCITPPRTTVACYVLTCFVSRNFYNALNTLTLYCAYRVPGNNLLLLLYLGTLILHFHINKSVITLPSCGLELFLFIYVVSSGVFMQFICGQIYHTAKDCFCNVRCMMISNTYKNTNFKTKLSFSV